MNEEFQLKLQAYLDGELPSAEAAQVEQWLERDPEARALRLELQNTAGALTGHEAEIKLPESREFFWSKIEREIGRQSAAPEPAHKPYWLLWVLRALIPAGTIAVICLLGIKFSPASAAAEFSPELEVAADDMGAYTFRNQADGLTMIWLYDKAPDTQSAQSARPVILAAR
jgi:anti-sigma factor RsiW